VGDDFRKQYESYASPRLVKIANSDTGEYRTEAIEAARAELTSRGETWQISQDNGTGEHLDSSSEEKGDKGVRKDFLEARNIFLFAVGIVWSYLYTASRYGFSTEFTMGATTGTLLIPLIVSYSWKGRKRDWRGMAVVFAIGCFVWTVFNRLTS
jgi:hypothetical protein